MHNPHVLAGILERTFIHQLSIYESCITRGLQVHTRVWVLLHFHFSVSYTHANIHSLVHRSGAYEECKHRERITTSSLERVLEDLLSCKQEVCPHVVTFF